MGKILQIICNNILGWPRHRKFEQEIVGFIPKVRAPQKVDRHPPANAVKSIERLPLSSINENNLEQILTAFRRTRATSAVALIQYESTQKGTDKISMDDIDAEIEEVRSNRKKCHQLN